MERRAWILVSIAAVLAVVLGVMVANLRTTEGPRPVPEEGGGASPAGAGERPPRAGTGEGRTPSGGGDGATPAPPPAAPAPELTGVVIDSFSRGGIAGVEVAAVALLPGAAEAAEPATSDVDAPWPKAPPATGASSAAGTKTAADGTFRIPWPDAVAAQVTARAEGYGKTAAVVERGTRAEIVLSRGGSIRGRTVDREGAPVGGAWLRARGEGSATPETWAEADAEGRFEVKDLAAGRYAVTANAPGRMSSGVVVDLPGVGDVNVVLAPALVVWVAFRGQGDAIPARARVVATAGEVEVASRVVEPERPHATAPGGARLAAGPLRVAAAAGEVTVTVSAAGFTSWTSERLAMPPAGGDVVLEPTMERDPKVGGIRLRLVDAGGGGGLSARAGVVRWMRADAAALPLEVAAAPDEQLRIEGLPPGAYRLAISYPGREPTEATATVAGGSVASVEAALSAGARLRVRVKAPQGRAVRARVAQAGQAAPAFAEGARRSAAEGPESGVFLVGADGVVLTGLGDGPYTVEVVDPKWTAEPAEVRPSRHALREVELTAVPR